MPDGGDYHAFNSTKGDTGGSGGGSGINGPGWVVIVIVAILLISMIADGTSWDAIDSLLGIGLLVFLLAKALG